MNLINLQVPQEPVLFSGTIRSNIMYGSEVRIDDDDRYDQGVTPEQFDEVVKEMNITDFVDKMPNGFDS